MNKKVFLPIAFFLIIMAVFSSFQNQPDHKVLFEKAKYTMETKADLKEAINLFELLIKTYPNEKEYAANSQLLIGICYEKLGRSEAIKSYQAVLDKYPDQQNVVAQARKKLELLTGNSQSIMAKGEFSIRKVWADPPETYGGGISPNGRYLTFINWDSAEMAIHDLKTGETRDLTNEGFWGQDSNQFPDASVWSPDSKQIAYSWYIDEGKTRRIELRSININGGSYSILANDEGSKNLNPKAWSKDGRTIWTMKGNTIITILVADGTIDKVHSLGQVGRSGKMDISPDGKYFIYDASQESNRNIFDIHLVSADGKKNVIIAPHSAHDWAPQWSIDGKYILFLSARTGSSALWSVKVENGVQVSEPVMVKGSLPNQSYPLGVSDAGDYYFSISNTFSDIYIADMDLETGKLITQPKKMKVELEAFNFKPLWLPDGKSLNYMSRRKNSSPPWFMETKIVTHNLETGKIHSIVEEGFSPNPNVQWSYHTITKNGKSLVGIRSIENEINSFFKIDLVNGESEVLKKGSPNIHKMDEVGRFPKLSDDGQILYHISSDRKAIVSYNLANKTETDIFRSLKAIDLIAYSPDMKEAVFTYFEHKNRNQLWLISLKGGNPKLLGSLNKGDSHKNQVLSELVWSPDSKYVLCKSAPDEYLWRIAKNGEGGFLKCDLSMKNRNYIQVNPDGSKIVFVEPRGKYKEVWVMENYFPKE